MSSKAGRKLQPQQPPKELTKWQKMLVPGSTWVKNDLLDVVGFVKQIIAVFIGLIWGLIPLLGSTGIISFFVICIFATFIYYTKYLKVNDEEFGRFELIQEGLFPAFALFLLGWIITYNAFHVSPLK